MVDVDVRRRVEWRTPLRLQRQFKLTLSSAETLISRFFPSSISSAASPGSSNCLFWLPISLESYSVKLPFLSLFLTRPNIDFTRPNRLDRFQSPRSVLHHFVFKLFAETSPPKSQLLPSTRYLASLRQIVCVSTIVFYRVLFCVF